MLAAALQAVPDVRACNVAAQTLAGDVAGLELQLKYKKADLKQGQEELAKLQVGLCRVCRVCCLFAQVCCCLWHVWLYCVESMPLLQPVSKLCDKHAMLTLTDISSYSTHIPIEYAYAAHAVLAAASPCSVRCQCYRRLLPTLAQTLQLPSCSSRWRSSGSRWPSWTTA